jgi:lambda repressor-like predicted transcriptional regulator
MNSDVEEILQALRDADLAWLADQIAIAISNGKVVTKEYRTSGTRGLKRKGTKIEPLSDEEQLEVTLKALRSYTIELRKAWEFAQRTIGEDVRGVPEQSLSISIVPPEGGTALEPFGRDVGVHQATLEGLLRQAWPKGESDYSRIFQGETAT